VGIDVILGMKWMSGNGVLIDTTTRVVMLRDPNTKEAFLVQLPRDIHIRSTMNAITSMVIKDILVVCEFPDVFSDDLLGLPLDRDVEFKIELLPSTAPISRRPYRMPPNELADLKTQLNELLKKGLIRPSSSPWGCPAIFVKKKDQSLRMCGLSSSECGDHQKQVPFFLALISYLISCLKPMYSPRLICDLGIIRSRYVR